MFRISTVELTDFRSFIGTHTWDLNEGPGLFHLIGVNNENPRLGSNGVGKSSLLDAIVWGLTGRTTRLLRGNDVVNYSASGCSVRIIADIRSNIDTIERTQNPNSLTLNGYVIEQQALFNHLGLNFESIMYSIVNIGNYFLDLKPSEKLTLFSDILELEYWLDRSKEADKQATVIEGTVIRTKNETFKLQGGELSLLSTIKELTEQSDKWNDNHRDRIKGYTSELSNIKKQAYTHEKELIESGEYLRTGKEKIKALESELPELEDNLKLLDGEIHSADKAIAITSNELDRLIANLNAFSELENEAVCPHCKQQVNKKHLDKEEARITKQVMAYKQEIADLKLVKQEVKLDKAQIVAALGVKKSELIALSSSNLRLQRTFDTAKIRMESLDAETVKVKKQIKLIEAEENKFEEMIIIKNKELDELTKLIANKKSEIESLNEEHAAVSYWISGFKQIRLNIVDETLRNLEIEVNNSLEALGMVNWTIEFDIERENKSGGITKGFTTFIHDHKGRTVKYEAISGGEGQRVRLAATFGLSNLIMERAGLVSKTEFYDEISPRMSEVGVKDMLDALLHRAADRMITIIDHHSIDYGDFTDKWTVVKDNDGSPSIKKG